MQRSLAAPARRSDFNKLWAGQSTSLLGDQIVVIALPLLAVTALGVPPAEAALLRFALFVPFLLFGLQAGPLVDRLPRRTLLIGCDAAQLFCYLVIAVLAATDALTFALLMALVAISGTAIVFFQIAYTSYLPQLFSHERTLQSANSKLHFSESTSTTLGPVLAGPLIAFAGLATALFVNAATFAVSLALLLAIRMRERLAPPAPRGRGWLRREIAEGLRFVFAHPLLQPVFVCGAVYVVFLGMVQTTIVLYCHEQLRLDTTLIGVVVGAAAVGLAIGNVLSSAVVRRHGMPRTLVGGAIVSVSGLALLPIMGALGSVSGMIVASIVHGIGEGTFGPTSLTLRQIVSPARLLGRVNSVQRFLLWGAAPIGSLLAAGAIGLFSLQGAMFIGGLGASLCIAPLLRRGILADLRRSRYSAPTASSVPNATVDVAPSHQMT